MIKNIMFTGGLGQVRLCVNPHDVPSNLKTAKEIAAFVAQDLGPKYHWCGFYDESDELVEEFTFAQGKAMLAYHAIEGFKYESEIRATVTEALELVGLKMPE